MRPQAALGALLSHSRRPHAVQSARLRVHACSLSQSPLSPVRSPVDLNFLLVVSRVLEFITPELSRTSLANIVADVRASMLDEVDFTKAR